MKLFDKDGAWNWADNNNVVLGFRNQSDCCEQFGYHYSLSEPVDMSFFDVPSDYNPDIEDFSFDPKWFKEFGDNDGGGNAVFRLVAADGSVIYLLIYNHHNGYYSHGFELKDQYGCEIQEGRL